MEYTSSEFDEKINDIRAREIALWDEYSKTKDRTIYDKLREEKCKLIDEEIARLKPIAAGLWKEYNVTGDQSIKAEVARLKSEKGELEKELDLITDDKEKVNTKFKIQNLEELIRRTQMKYTDSFDKTLKKKIDECEGRIRDLGMMKNYGVYGDGPVTDLNHSAAIPLGPYDPNAKFDPNSIYNDASPVIDPNLSDEERYVDSLCLQMPYDERATYDVKNSDSNFVVHYIPKDISGGTRPGLKNSGTNWTKTKIVETSLGLEEKDVPLKVSHTYRPIVHEVQLGLEYSPSDRNVDYYINLFENNDKGKKEVGYHFLCNDDKIVCFIPMDEIAYHASSRTYNYNSVGIERITTEDVGTDAIYNQAKLVATIMYMQGIPINRVMTHFSATNGLPSMVDEKFVRDDNNEIMYTTPKSCPDRLLNGKYGGMHLFTQVIVNCLRSGDLFVKELEDVKSAFEELDRENASLGTEIVIESKGKARK